MDYKVRVENNIVEERLKEMASRHKQFEDKQDGEKGKIK